MFTLVYKIHFKWIYYQRPIDYEKCIGKWGKFWDDDKSVFIVAKLFKYLPKNEYKFFAENIPGSGIPYKNFELLTASKFRSLGL